MLAVKSIAARPSVSPAVLVVSPGNGAGVGQHRPLDEGVRKDADLQHRAGRSAANRVVDVHDRKRMIGVALLCVANRLPLDEAARLFERGPCGPGRRLFRRRERVLVDLDTRILAVGRCARAEMHEVHRIASLDQGHGLGAIAIENLDELAHAQPGHVGKGVVAGGVWLARDQEDELGIGHSASSSDRRDEACCGPTDRARGNGTLREANYG